jgi:hypothetical protein
VSCESPRGGATAAPRPCTVPLLRGMDTINNSPVPAKRSSVSFDGRRSEFLLHNRLTYLQPTIAHPHLSSTPSRTPLCVPCPSSSIPGVCVPVETSEMGGRAAGGYVRCGVGGGGQGMLTFPRERHLTPQASCIPEDPPPPVNVVAALARTVSLSCSCCCPRVVLSL